ncbi:hypothetical protein Tco_0908975 [Tanacetum coccineum]|uniref:Uncharacterized protein n=1 Tax=Tanacetum coccineum TaxID=301880 RepID=A0ABQ5CNU7_9ASTR
MLNKKLQGDRWNEMYYQLLNLMTKQEKGEEQASAFKPIVSLHHNFIQAKDKGTGKMFEKERVAHQEAIREAVIEELDSIHAMIDADEELAAKLQAEEQEKFSIEENTRMLVEMLKGKIIMEYLVKISKKARILELKRRHLKITVLTSNTPYPSRKIRRICACTSLKTTKEQDPIRRSWSDSGEEDDEKDKDEHVLWHTASSEVVPESSYTNE